MTKRAFIKKITALGIASPFITTLLSSCDKNADFFPDYEINFSGKVIIVGAGATGITAGHILNKQGIDFQILEATAVHGGRVKKAIDFADFPIDLGAEWIHTDPSILAKLNNDRASNVDIDLITYNPQIVAVWKNGKLRSRNIASHFYSEYKFKNSTWFDFFDELMIPNIRDRITYNTPVTEIDYSDNIVTVKTSNDEIFEADKVIVTVPISILQNEFITFVPSLSAEKMDAIKEEWMPDGLKVFIEFSERFYPDMLAVNSLLETANEGEHLYYDAAFGKDSDKNVFALFTVGEKAAPYTSLGTDKAIFDKVMGELDDMFDGKASQFYIKHLVQNWTQEPFIQGSYSHGYGSVDMLAATVENRIFFAGEAMAPNGNTSTVHGAAESAYDTVKKMLTT